MVPTETVIKTAIAENVDIICLSGLITPSLEEMCHVAEEMEKAGMSIPLMIGGATTSKIHTAVKIAPRYSGPVIHVKDASQNPLIAAQLANKETYGIFLKQLQDEQKKLRESVKEKMPLISLEEARKHKFKPDWTKYNPIKPILPGKIQKLHFSINEIRPYINWIFFFNAWKLGGKFASVAFINGCDHCKASWLTQFPEQERAKASEAMQLHKEATRMLDKLITNGIKIDILLGIFEANSQDESIRIQKKDTFLTIPCLRQQIQKKENDAYYYSLSDFVMPSDMKRTDYIGAFTVTAGEDIENLIEYYKCQNDNYNALLLQSLADRIAEAATELLHYRVRKNIWGYSPEEEANIESLLKEHYQGIRPAIGYPSLPDQSLAFDIDKLLGFNQIGVSLTENGAMKPNSTVSGIMIAHPQATYFHIGQIDSEQRAEYCKKRGFSVEESNKWLSV